MSNLIKDKVSRNENNRNLLRNSSEYDDELYVENYYRKSCCKDKKKGIEIIRK